ncbi:hypothetical protein MY4038_007805 [Beauveria bassiana]
MTTTPSPEQPRPAPTASSPISLREITAQNFRAVIDLDMREGQRGNVSSNARSLCEAHYSPDAWVRAVYADDAPGTPVGFLMMSIWDPDAWCSIWRFMVDGRYQGLGFGARAVRLAVEHVRENHPRTRMLRLLSASPEGKAARGGKPPVEARYSPYWFYYKLGFRDVEPVDEYGEIEMGLDLKKP